MIISITIWWIDDTIIEFQIRSDDVWYYAEFAAGWGELWTTSYNTELILWNCERFNVLFCPMSWQEDAIILCVAQEAGWGWQWLLVSTGKCPGYWENTKLSQYWGKKHTKWHYEGRTKCFLVSSPQKLHSCFYWKMMGHHRKSKILFIFLPSYSWSWSKSTVPSDASNKQLDDDFWMSRASQ